MNIYAPAFIDWNAHPGDYARVAVTGVLAAVAVILLARVTGLRSFSKMSSVDFAFTIAIGSILATVIVSPSPPLLLTLTGLAMVFFIQKAFAWLRFIPGFSKVAENKPTLIMEGPRFLHGAMRACSITEADIRSKLRAAGVTDLDQVRAVVLEGTGDVSVISSTNPDQRLDPRLLEGVRQI